MGTAVKVATALLCDTYVGKGGRRAKCGDDDAVRIYLMNVLRESDSGFEIRRKLLEEVLARVSSGERAVLLTPAGYFGFESGSSSPSEPVWIGRHGMDRDAVVRYLHALELRPGLLLAAGIDHAGGARQTFHFLEGGSSARRQEIVRRQSARDERLFEFGGLTFFATVCAEFMGNGQGPMYGEEPHYFDVEKDILGRCVDVVLNAAHVGVRCTQGREDISTKRFPFETFFRKVSRSGAACFLAHHHSNVPGSSGFRRNDCYSNWGMFAGEGQYSDWMGENNPVKEVDVGL